jgi:phosphatidylglycerol:prolipoprotein diacylglycerol transferase
MLPALDIRGIAFPTGKLMLLVGFWLAVHVAEALAKRRGGDGAGITNALLLGAGVGLLGARLSYVVQHLAAYVRTPMALFVFSNQGLSWIEGLLIGLLAIFVVLRRKRIALGDAADALVPALAVFWGIAGFGAFLSGDAYGQPTTVAWGVFLWNDYRHPVQLYELMAGGLVFMVLGILAPRTPYPGWIALVGLALLGIARLFIEGFRGDPATTVDGLRVAQLWAFGLTLLALWGLYYLQRRVEDGAPPRQNTEEFNAFMAPENEAIAL